MRVNRRIMPFGSVCKNDVFCSKFCSENNIVLEFCLVLCVHRIVRWLSLSDHVGIEGVFLKNTVGEDDESTIPLN